MAKHNTSMNVALSAVQSAKYNPNESQVNQRIWLEVGHAYEPRRWASGRAVPEDWRVWVRGVAGADISALVEKVVFQLFPDSQFPYPKKIYLDAPYQLEEAGAAPREVRIAIHFKCSTKPEVLHVTYGPLFAKSDQSSAHSSCIFYDFRNPTDQLRIGLQSVSSAHSTDSALVVLPASDEVRSQPQPHRDQPSHSNKT